jgi:hypothetical protein
LLVGKQAKQSTRLWLGVARGMMHPKGKPSYICEIDATKKGEAKLHASLDLSLHTVITPHYQQLASAYTYSSPHVFPPAMAVAKKRSHQLYVIASLTSQQTIDRSIDLSAAGW